MTEKKKFNYSQLTAGQYKVSGLRLLTTNSLKTIKGLKQDVLSGILYLAPHATANAKHKDGTRANVCPAASAGCMASCLYRSGAALIYKKVNAARVRKTKQFVSNPAAFMVDVVYDVAKIETRRGKKQHATCYPSQRNVRSTLGTSTGCSRRRVV